MTGDRRRARGVAHLLKGGLAVGAGCCSMALSAARTTSR
jgi:hypothetical protein